MHVCIDARLEPGVTGGVETLVVSLARSLVEQGEGSERYSALIHERNLAWARDVFPASLTLITLPENRRRRLWTKFSAAGVGRRLADHVRTARGLLGGATFRPQREPSELAQTDVELVHFLSQAAFTSHRKTIYHPHDLQHLHLPDFFTRFQYQTREAFYRFFCERADRVCVASRWVKRDVEKHYRVPAERITVINLPPDLSTNVPATLSHHLVPAGAQFVLYPAQTWPHKNHRALIRALHDLRDALPELRCVFTGALTDFAPTLRNEARRLGVEDRIDFLGFVGRGELRDLYARARLVAVPTLFEAASFPIWEAFAAGVPVVCSNVTSLPEQAGDAAVVIDPNDQAALNEAIARVWTDDALRDLLVRRGRARLSNVSWASTARKFRALYRYVLGRATKADEEVLSEADAF